MQCALQLADRARQAGEVPVGAVIVQADRKIGEGYNQTITTFDPTAHAEIVALRDAARGLGNHRIKDADLYVTIEPCTMCAGALVHARIARLIYGATEPKAGAIDSSIHVLANPSLNHQVEVISGICGEAAAEKISTFFKTKRS